MIGTENTAAAAVGYVQLTLHLVNGGQHRFVQTNPHIAQTLLEQLRPARAFSQKQIIIAGTDAVTVIPTDTIERIDLRADPLPSWPHGERVVSIQEVSKEEFSLLRRELPSGLPQGAVGMLAELRSGAAVHLKLHLVPPQSTDKNMPITPDDGRAFLQHLFNRHVVFGDLDDNQGIFLLNPATAVRFVLSPPLPVQSLASIWAMEHEVI